MRKRRGRERPRGLLQFLFFLYKVMRALLILALVAALAFAGWLYLKYRAGERGIRLAVDIRLPTAAAGYVPQQDDPYYALYGVDPLATDAPTAPTATPRPTAALTKEPTVTPAATATPRPTAAPTAAPQMETVPPKATPAPTVAPTPAPTPVPTATPGIPEVDGRFTFGETVIHEGKRYTFSSNVTSLLFLGIDNPDAVSVRAQGFGKGDQTDVILLAAIDRDKKLVTLINISRDTMTDVDILSYDHRYVVGTREMQIALAHAYGDGAELSGLLEAEAVSNLLGGLPINGYLSINYGALVVVNDLVGGVTVTLEEGMSILGEEYEAGDSVKLAGEMVTDYVRNRSVGAGTNSERMNRQEGYIRGFIGACLARGGNPAALVLDLYGGAEDYIATSLTEDELVYLGAAVLDGDWEVEIVGVPGELKLGDIYEFYPDEAELSKILLDVFFTAD